MILVRILLQNVELKRKFHHKITLQILQRIPYVRKHNNAEIAEQGLHFRGDCGKSKYS